MSVFMTLRIALKALARNKMRTVLTMLGMIIGVAAVITMVALGAGTVVFGFLTSLAGFAALLFCGFAAFFLGKISADTIMQQSMPDDFRGRAFALFDIAYNLGFIIPALVLVAVWADERVRTILVGSGIVFLGLTVFVARWARAIRDQLAPQDDLV